jgi:hypothetical protein
LNRGANANSTVANSNSHGTVGRKPASPIAIKIHAPKAAPTRLISMIGMISRKCRRTSS